MEITKTLYVADRKAWRAWLEKNHARASEIWLIYYKKHTGRPRIPYDDAVEEALCFGWIDSTVKRMDEERFAQRFTPRKDKSNWSEPNKKKARKLIEEGRMTQAGLDRIADGVLDSPAKETPKRAAELVVPRYVAQALKANSAAWENFNGLAKSYRREYVTWIEDAKKEETRQKRLNEAVRLLAENKKLGMK